MRVLIYYLKRRLELLRPFGQSKYNTNELQIEKLSGYAYKFSLLLPITEKGKFIFSSQEEEEMRTLFEEDFGGYTCTQGVTHPLVMGGYIDENGIRVLNEHTRFEAYTKQTDLAIRYFEELERNLIKYSENVIAKRVENYKGEKKILIELTSVKLL